MVLCLLQAVAAFLGKHLTTSDLISIATALFLGGPTLWFAVVAARAAQESVRLGREQAAQRPDMRVSYPEGQTSTRVAKPAPPPPPPPPPPPDKLLPGMAAMAQALESLRLWHTGLDADPKPDAVLTLEVLNRGRVSAHNVVVWVSVDPRSCVFCKSSSFLALSMPRHRYWMLDADDDEDGPNDTAPRAQLHVAELVPDTRALFELPMRGVASGKTALRYHGTCAEGDTPEGTLDLDIVG